MVCAVAAAGCASSAGMKSTPPGRRVNPHWWIREALQRGRRCARPGDLTEDHDDALALGWSPEGFVLPSANGRLRRLAGPIPPRHEPPAPGLFAGNRDTSNTAPAR